MIVTNLELTSWVGHPAGDGVKHLVAISLNKLLETSIADEVFTKASGVQEALLTI